MHPVFQAATRLLLPAVCLSCRADMEGGATSSLCLSCVSRVRWRSECELLPGLSLERVHAAGVFEGPLRDLLHAFKYEGKDYLAPVLAKFWLKRTSFFPDQFDVVVPVPASRWKVWKRGYNQAAFLAAEISRTWRKPLAGSLLCRRAWSFSQTALSRKKRFQNANLSFRIRYPTKTVEGLAVLLIDDVCTTGATLAACAQLLIRAGAKRVCAGVVARELLD